MEFELWERYYLEILKDFNFSREEDEASARILKDSLRVINPPLEELRDLIEDKSVWVVGNAPSLAEELSSKRLEGTVIAADESVSILLASNIHPHVIVTDLDGNIPDILKANGQGSIVLVHAHGDNIEAVKKYAHMFKKKVIGTTQSRPFDNIHNFGGFTDGDRAVFLADHFNAGKIKLLGFDFKNINEEKEDESKRRKLDWAYILIQSLNNPNIIF